MPMNALKGKSVGFLRSHSNIVSPNSHQYNSSYAVIDTSILSAVLPFQQQNFPFSTIEARISPINDIEPVDPTDQENIEMMNHQYDPNPRALVKHSSSSRNNKQYNQGQGNVLPTQGSSKYPQQPQDPRRIQNDGKPQNAFPSQSRSITPQMNQVNATQDNAQLSNNRTNANQRDHPPARKQDFATPQAGHIVQPMTSIAQHKSQANLKTTSHNQGAARQTAVVAQDYASSRDNMPPPPNFGKTSNNRDQYHREAPPDPRSRANAQSHSLKPALTVDQFPRTQHYPHGENEEQFEELGSDIDAFGDVSTEEVTPPSGHNFHQASQIAPGYELPVASKQVSQMHDYPLTHNRSKSTQPTGRSSSFQIPGVAGVPLSRQHQANINEVEHLPVQQSRNPNHPSKAHRSAPQSAKNMLYPQANSHNDVFTQPAMPGSGLDEDGLPVFDDSKFDNSGIPVTPTNHVSRQSNSSNNESAFNFTPSAKESDTVEEVIPQPEPRFKIPFELSNHFILIKTFVNREQIFQDVIKNCQVPDFQPAWGDVKSEGSEIEIGTTDRSSWLTEFVEGHNDIADTLNNCHQYFTTLEKSLTNLVSIKETELKRKIGLTQRYGDAGSDLSSQCQTMQLSTRNNVRNNVKKRKVDGWGD